MTDIVAIDIGGTHARFAIAQIADGHVVELGDPVTIRTADHASLESAWGAFAQKAGRALPRAAAIAIASPVHGDAIKLTNASWVIRPAEIDAALGLDRHLLVNDFGAVGHAVASLQPTHFRHLCGPDRPLPDYGVIAVVGPGTGLGVAHVLRSDQGHVVTETEGGHIGFAPSDAIEDALLASLRARHGRVSVERIVSGPGIVSIHDVLAGADRAQRDDKAIWAAALAGDDATASTALDRFCQCLGAVAGDIALAQGASALVIAGGLGLRIADRLAESGFAARFADKGRFREIMEAMPVKLITHPQPGLYGAAAALAATD
jgi:glucokinase